MKLTLGPIPYYWGVKETLRFYETIAGTEIEEIYLGESVCSKRQLSLERLQGTARMLEGAGKRVILSTLALAITEEEMDFTRRLCDLPYLIEANEMGVVALCEERGRTFIAGPYLGIYNPPSLAFLHALGARRIVLLPELSGEVLRAGLEIPVEREVLGYGPLTVALSGRCYTARALEVSKAHCALVCGDYPEGMPLETLDGHPLYRLNGTEILSAPYHCVIELLDALRDAGATHLRILPQREGTPEVLDLFSRVLTGRMDGAEAVGRLRALAPAPLCNGWFFGKPGHQYVGARRQEASSC
jgi:collagenase-like PrtC family protease